MWRSLVTKGEGEKKPIPHVLNQSKEGQLFFVFMRQQKRKLVAGGGVWQDWRVRLGVSECNLLQMDFLGVQWQGLETFRGFSQP